MTLIDIPCYISSPAHSTQLYMNKMSAKYLDKFSVAVYGASPATAVINGSF